MRVLFLHTFKGEIWLSFVIAAFLTKFDLPLCCGLTNERTKFELLSPVMSSEDSFSVELLSGASAGLVVDIVLFPIDTIKTRLQSPHGLRKTGGYSKIYAGIATVLGSAPSAATFFVTYETFKSFYVKKFGTQHPSLVHMTAASVGEVASCIVRVPSEVVKQRAQADSKTTSWKVFSNIVRTEGPVGLYRGFASTLMRDVPFSFIQFPIWEKLKVLCASKKKSPVTAWDSAFSGAVAGGIAAALTTPLDMAKTRIMLAKGGTTTSRGNIFIVLKDVYSQNGINGLFSGIVPRVIWISFGGAIFFGAYEKTKSFVSTWHSKR